MVKVDSAIIMAAGTSSRFAPLSYEKPKGLIRVKGQVLVERQIEQLREAGIDQIVLVVGYRKEDFLYLKEKYGVVIVDNDDYNTRNNNASIYLARDYIKNSYICSVDNYFYDNPFSSHEDSSYYSALYSEDFINEWCLTYDENNIITDVKIGGEKSWYMLGHVFWDEEFSNKFLDVLEYVYDLPETKDKLWETIYIENIKELPMKIKKFGDNYIFEFDSLDELREFDPTYKNDTGSSIMEKISCELACLQEEIVDIQIIKEANEAIGFYFTYKNLRYSYFYKDAKLKLA